MYRLSQVTLLSVTIFSLVACYIAQASSDKEVSKTYVTMQKIESMCENIYQQVQQDNFTPDLLIGLSRGGLVPLGFLAGEQMFNNRNARVINLRSYDDHGNQANLNLLWPMHIDELKQYRSILIIDDLVDSGKSVDFIYTILKNELPNTDIRVATLFYKPRSKIKPTYYVEETDDWIVFPWEK